MLGGHRRRCGTCRAGTPRPKERDRFAVEGLGFGIRSQRVLAGLFEPRELTIASILSGNRIETRGRELHVAGDVFGRHQNLRAHAPATLFIVHAAAEKAVAPEIGAAEFVLSARQGSTHPRLVIISPCAETSTALQPPVRRTLASCR